MMDDNLLLENAQRMHEESRMFEERLQVIEQQIVELQDFQKGLEHFNDSAAGDIMASIGKGVYVKGIANKSDFFVDIGAGIIVKKRLPEVSGIIEEQITRLEAMRGEANERLGDLQESFGEILNEINERKKDQ